MATAAGLLREDALAGWPGSSVVPPAIIPIPEPPDVPTLDRPSGPSSNCAANCAVGGTPSSPMIVAGANGGATSTSTVGGTTKSSGISWWWIGLPLLAALGLIFLPDDDDRAK